jgi:hypothetical protein
LLQVDSAMLFELFLFIIYFSYKVLSLSAISNAEEEGEKKINVLKL